MCSNVVLLLRAPSDAPDRYESVFSEAGYRPLSVPVLETVFVNQETLTEIVRSGSSQHGGVIVTSGRACEAWGKAVEVLKNEQAHSEGLVATAARRSTHILDKTPIGRPYHST